MKVDVHFVPFIEFVQYNFIIDIELDFNTVKI